MKSHADESKDGMKSLEPPGNARMFRFADRGLAAKFRERLATAAFPHVFTDDDILIFDAANEAEVGTEAGAVIDEVFSGQLYFWSSWWSPAQTMAVRERLVRLGCLFIEQAYHDHTCFCIPLSFCEAHDRLVEEVYGDFATNTEQDKPS